MSTDNINLNLARKWRSKNFDQIIGQELSIRMLKNSLYLNQFFPVYLFSGQRGCGKTSTARVFAAAINCKQLHTFQKEPRGNVVPCLMCSSCKAMLNGNHPDFIEIDAASHTGVDNVRQIIEASSFLPLVGSKKIYLIDEAHMLSKAAFNAFLKILEEPPPSVIFILATTNPQKIIETVRSRCFQLFFRPVTFDPLVGHLKKICVAEKISFDDDGLSIIVKESQGSVRDSINILEQVRFSASCISKESVHKILGHIDNERLIQLFAHIFTKGPQKVLTFIKELKFESFSAEYFWHKMIELLRVAIWVKHGVDPSWSVDNLVLLKKIVRGCSIISLNEAMQLFYDNESVFLKTTAKHSLLEMILIQISQKNSDDNVPDKSGASAAPEAVASVEEDEFEDEEEEEEVEEIEEVQAVAKKEEALADKKKPKEKGWHSFLSLLDTLNDPLLSSIFKNGKFVSFNKETGDLAIEYLRQFSFFKDSFEETKSSWLPLMQQNFSQNVQFKPLFEGEGPVKVSAKSRVSAQKIEATTSNKSNNSTSSYQKAPQNLYRASRNNVKSNKASVFEQKGKLVDVSDVATWKKANALLKYFSGSVREIQDI